jgi:hypothetical protein
MKQRKQLKIKQKIAQHFLTWGNKKHLGHGVSLLKLHIMIILKSCHPGSDTYPVGQQWGML